jgi:putative oxidoreductase
MLGIVTRVATLPLLAMLLVLQLVYPADWPNNVLWGSMLLFLLTRGPGQFSVDHTIERHFVKRQ